MDAERGLQPGDHGGRKVLIGPYRRKELAGSVRKGHAEVIAVARAEGVHWGEEDLEGYMALADTLTQMECRP